MRFSLTILGSGAAAPTMRRQPSGQLLNIHDKFFLIDCAEGTQMQLRRFKVKFQRINNIFISHLHGDHYLGLLGLMSSMHLLGRKRDLNIYAPGKLKELIELNLKHSETFLNYKYVFHTLEGKKEDLIFEDNTVKASSFPLKHRIECYGFRFEEKKRQPKIKKSKIEELGLTVSEIRKLKNGEDIEVQGKLYKNEKLTEKVAVPRKFAYCSDTAYYEKILPSIKEVDLLYHESTFLDLLKVRAKETFHSTASQAAEIAKKANVRALLLGHFSSRYRSLDDFLNEAKPVFSNVSVAKDGMIIEVEPVHN